MADPLRLLYVDDESDLLEICRIFLEESGDFNVTTALSAPDAIRLLEQEKFDAIISDYQMPGMDGIQFLVEVRTRLGPIPFILFTGKGREEVVIQAINSGADFYLQKGGEPHAQFAELVHKIKSAVSRKRVDDTLRESEVKYRSLFDNAILGFFRTTPEGRYLDMNAAFARIAGYDSPEEMKAAIHDIGKQLIVRPEDRQKIGKLLTLNGVIRNFETEIRHRDGHPIWISINATNVRSENGSVLWWDGTIEDITARKVAEQALQDSEANYLQVINTMDETLSVIDPDGNFLFVNNNAALNLSGGTPEDVTAKNIREFVPSEAELLIEKYRSVVASGQPVKGDIRISLKSGERWFSNVLQPIHYGQTKVPAVLSISLDITERKRAEMALQDSNELFTQFIRHSPFYTYIKTMTANESRILYVSDTYNPMTGLSGRDMVGKNPTELLPAEVAAKVTADDWAVISNGTVQELIREYGGRHYNILKFPIVQRDKIFLAGYTIDITERKQAEYALRESEALLSDIIEKNPMSIQIVDREGFTLRVNPAFMRLFGSVPPPDYSIITDLVKSRPELENLISQVKSGEAVNLPDMSFNPHDIYPELPDVPTRVRAIIFPLNDRHGKPQRFVFMHEDITGQKQTEEALHQANRKLKLMSGITRHDINNQLLVLNGFLKLLHKKISNEELEDSFIRITKASSQISSMIQFTREYEEIGVNAPVWLECRNLVDTASKQAPLGTVMVKNDIPAGTDVFADPLIVKVFYNLMDNAARYGGKITTIRFSVEEAGEDRVIVCEDDGDGIVAVEKEKIFERRFGKNTGLGLFLAWEILSITGITITENGEPGKGARFEMTVPKRMWRMNPGSY